MAKVYATPGVYIEEKSAFPNSAVPVATAVPAFIGYTEKALIGKKSLKGVPTRISSYNEFLQFFGGAPTTKYNLVVPAAAEAEGGEEEGEPEEGGGEEGGGQETPPEEILYDLEVGEENFILHSSMKLFFSNGGSDCYIVSVGSYKDGKVDKKALLKGIEPLKKEPEPTMLVIPEAVLLEDPKECAEIQQGMLLHCGMVMRNRFSILDVYGGTEKRSPVKEDDVIEKFRTDIGANQLQWGAAYYPWLETTAVPASELTFKNFINIGAADDIVAFQDNPDAGDNDPPRILPEDQLTAQQTGFASAPTLIKLLDLNLNQEHTDGLVNLARAEAIKEELTKLATLTGGGEGASDIDPLGLHQTLLAISPSYKSVLDDLKKKINTLPPSAAMAGIYSMVDNTIGVYQSPANVSVGSVVKPVVNLTNDEQEDLNVPLTGKAVNAIRTFPGKGVLVWGARTLDGNSQDWRYVSVRRTVIFIEQSIKYAAEAYVFEPNVSSTWTNLKALITNFLTNVWQAGALAGATPEDAFGVDVGLGVTMTPTDILDGIMRITVKLAVTRPAEFIVITFEQKMQQS